MRCTFCAGEHKQHECKVTQPSCVNFGGLTALFAAACKIRKDLIKQKSGEIREKNRSQSQHNQYESYAEATNANAGNDAKRGMGASVGGGLHGLTMKETKDIITTIMSAIVYTHYVEAKGPGSFKKKICLKCIS